MDEFLPHESLEKFKKSDLTKTPEAKARVNHYPPAHHAAWMVCGQRNMIAFLSYH
jgi:hypothetical protein